MNKLIAIYEVLYWFFSGASLIYPEMTRWEIAKKIWRNTVSNDDEVKEEKEDDTDSVQ